MATRRRWLPALVGAGLVGFGWLAILSIGLPFLVAGMIVLVDAATGVRRRRPEWFWPVVAAVGGFFVGFLAVAPWSCTSEASTVDSGRSFAATACRSLTGIGYAGGADYQPPAWPGVVAGTVTAALSAAGTRRGLTRGDG